MDLGKRDWKSRSRQGARQQIRIVEESEAQEVSLTAAGADQTAAETEQDSLRCYSGTEVVLYASPGMTAPGSQLSALALAESRRDCWTIQLHFPRAYQKQMLVLAAAAG